MHKKFLRLTAAVCSLLFLLTSCKSDDKGSSDTSSISSESSRVSTPSDTVPSSSEPPKESSEESGESGVQTLGQDLGAIAGLDNKKIGWGQGKQVNDKNQPLGSTDAQSKYGKYDARYIGDDNKKIYLTFDEGYENGYSAKILDVLKEKNVSGVFFVTYDYVKRNPELVKRMIDEGHVVGNHTWSHPSMPTVPLEQAKDEITKLHDYVKTEFGYEMSLFRPPMGEFSERTLAPTQALGYQSVFWSFAYADWDPDKQMDPEQAYQKVTGAAHDGAIYLLHAVSKTNTEILGRVIDDFRAKGFTVDKYDLKQ